MAFRVDPSRALVCDLPPGFGLLLNGGGVRPDAVFPIAVYADANQRVYSADELRPYVVDSLDLAPPVTSASQAWQRCDAGLGASSGRRSALVVFLNVLGTDAWVRADAHLQLAFGG